MRSHSKSMAEEIIIRIQIFEDDKKLFEITNIEELEDNEIESTISKLTAELKKRMED